MRVCGVICEYDPFHNGHAHHLRQVRALSGCDWVVCVMSGHFTQRGNAALVSKWARAEMALRCGADVVLELPALFAVRDAERFARGGVTLLARLGVVTHLGFGSESANLDALWACARTEGDGAAIRRGLAAGMTLARARGEAGLAPDMPNDILAVEYLRAMDALDSEIAPVAIRREGGGYHDAALSPMASATAVRAAIRRGEDVCHAMPPAAYAVLRPLLDAGAYQRADGLDVPLLALLRAAPAGWLAQAADAAEGVENRLRQAAQQAISREDLLVRAKCKRYTWTRLSRIATQALLGIDKQTVAESPLPGYARVLGFRQAARPLLAAMKKETQIPLVTRAAKFRADGGSAFAVDMRAGDLWALGLAGAEHRLGGMDLTHGVVIVGE